MLVWELICRISLRHILRKLITEILTMLPIFPRSFWKKGCLFLDPKHLFSLLLRPRRVGQGGNSLRFDRLLRFHDFGLVFFLSIISWRSCFFRLRQSQVVLVEPAVVVADQIFKVRDLWELFEELVLYHQRTTGYTSCHFECVVGVHNITVWSQSLEFSQQGPEVRKSFKFTTMATTWFIAAANDALNHFLPFLSIVTRNNRRAQSGCTSHLSNKRYLTHRPCQPCWLFVRFLRVKFRMIYYIIQKMEQSHAIILMLYLADIFR